jgi:hypothetical protein
MIISRLALLPFVYLLGACTPKAVNGVNDTSLLHQSTNPESAESFLSLVPHILAAIPEGVRANRPLLIDLRSFVLAGSSISGHDLNAADVRSAINAGFRDISSGEAIVNTGQGSYGIVDNGLHVRLDGISGGGARYSALITYLYAHNSTLGRTELYVTFHRQGEQWRVVGSSVLRTT